MSETSTLRSSFFCCRCRRKSKKITSGTSDPQQITPIANEDTDFVALVAEHETTLSKAAIDEPLNLINTVSQHSANVAAQPNDNPNKTQEFKRYSYSDSLLTEQRQIRLI